MSKQDYSAVLKNWFIIRQGNFAVLHGEIFGDDVGRFTDGSAIMTSPVTLPASFVEGNIVQTRKTRYLLGKRLGTKFDDGHELRNTEEEQIASLRGYMNARGYNMVYTDSSVFFRKKDPEARTANNQVSFRTAVVWHNKAEPFYGTNDVGIRRFFETPERMFPFRKVKKVKLQVTGNRIIVQSHKIELVETPKLQGFMAEIMEYQHRGQDRNEVEILLDQL